jgi:hypothetical protein
LPVSVRLGHRDPEHPFAHAFRAVEEHGVVLWRRQIGVGKERRDRTPSQVGPYFVANAQLGYTISHVRVYGYVENLLGSDQTIAVFSGATPAEDTADILPRRTYCSGVQVSF